MKRTQVFVIQELIWRDPVINVKAILHCLSQRRRIQILQAADELIVLNSELLHSTLSAGIERLLSADNQGSQLAHILLHSSSQMSITWYWRQLSVTICSIDSVERPHRPETSNFCQCHSL